MTDRTGFHNSHHTQSPKVMFIDSKDANVRHVTDTHFTYVFNESIHVKQNEGVLVSPVRWLCLLLFLLAPSAAVDAAGGAGPAVRTTGGLVRGKHIEECSVFRGVPFAAAPEGELRESRRRL